MSAVQDSERIWLDDAAEGRTHAARPLGQHVRQIRDDVSALAFELRETAADAERILTDRMQAHPVSTLGAAAGLGYVLGGGLRSRFTLVLLSAATRIVSVLAMREIGSRMSPRPPSAADR